METRICEEPELARLDRTLADAYAKAMRRWPDDAKVRERAAQRAWIASRNGCGNAGDVKACVDASYRRRLAEVQIRGGQLQAPTPVGYVCQGREGTPFWVSFYTQTDPKSAVITFGDRQAVALAAPSGSGARYTAPDLEFWEHHGEATVKWSGATYTCTAR